MTNRKAWTKADIEAEKELVNAGNDAFGLTYDESKAQEEDFLEFLSVMTGYSVDEIRTDLVKTYEAERAKGLSEVDAFTSTLRIMSPEQIDAFVHNLRQGAPATV